MLQPKKVKYRKPFIGHIKNKSYIIDKLHYGEYGLLSLENGYLDSKCIDAARKIIVGKTKRKGKLWLRIFPDKPITKRPAQVKMGGGKGDVDTWVAVIKKGQILFELGGINKEDASVALKSASYKLPFKVKIITQN